MLYFNLRNKGNITQYIKQNASPTYKAQGKIGHTGIDYYVGHGKLVKCDNPGYVYKTFDPFELKSNWTGVYILCDTTDDDIMMEITMGHFLENRVAEGQFVLTDQVVGIQGNYGNVWGTYNGKFQQIPVEAQKAGNTTAGSHVHEGWRPVRKVTKITKGEHYLKDSNGKRYKHNGKYLEIIHKDNGLRGCIDPMQYTKKRNWIERQIYDRLYAVIDQLQRQIAKLQGNKV